MFGGVKALLRGKTMAEETKDQAAKEAAAAEQKKAPKKKRKYTRRAKRSPGRPKGSGTKKAAEVAKRGPGRPKGSGKGKPGRPKGSGKRGRPKAAAVKTGVVSALVAKQVRALVKAERTALSAHVKNQVAKEVKKALKAAFR